MEQCQQLQQWEGKVSAKLPNTAAQQAWTLVHDFCSLHKLFPTVDDCHLVDGAEGLPGCVRHCTSASIPSADCSPVAWAKEKLLAVDQQGLSYTYEVIDSNIGFGMYVTQMKVVPEALADGGGAGKWSFVGEPVEGWTQEGLVSFLDAALQLVAKSIEDGSGAVNAQEKE